MIHLFPHRAKLPLLAEKKSLVQISRLPRVEAFMLMEALPGQTSRENTYGSLSVIHRTTRNAFEPQSCAKLLLCLTFFVDVLVKCFSRHKSGLTTRTIIRGVLWLRRVLWWVLKLRSGQHSTSVLLRKSYCMLVRP